MHLFCFMVLCSVERFYRPLKLSFFDTIQREMKHKSIWCYQWLYLTFKYVSMYEFVHTFLSVSRLWQIGLCCNFVSAMHSFDVMSIACLCVDQMLPH